MLRILREGDGNHRAAFLRHCITRNIANPEIMRAASELPPDMAEPLRKLGSAAIVPGAVEAFDGPGSQGRRRLLGFLARSVRKECLDEARHMARGVNGAIALHRNVLCRGGTLAAEMAGPGGAWGWMRADEEAEAMPGSWLVRAEADAGDVDWPRSIADSAFTPWRCIALRPGAHISVSGVEAAEGLPGHGGVVPGQVITLAAEPVAAPRRSPDVSVLDRKALLDAVPASGQVWSRCVDYDRHEIIALAGLTGGDPERWAALGRTLARVAEIEERDRRQTRVRDAVVAVSKFEGDPAGLMCLRETGRPGRYREWLSPHGTKGTWMVARVSDLDVAAMASAFLSDDEEVVILREGAVTWPPRSVPTPEATSGGLPEGLLPRIYADSMEEA